MEDIYEPGEDSFLLEKYVKEYAFGKVLDMGTGSGILGIAAQTNPEVREITFADINPNAIKRLRNFKEKNTVKRKFLTTDLFQNINTEEKSETKETKSFRVLKNNIFDTIIFNPPYLPNDPYDNAKDITTGGKKGHEVLERFLKEAKNHITDGGIILIVFSSLTNKRRIDNIIKNLGYDKGLLGKEKLFMEELYAYILTPIINYKGHRGKVHTCLYKNKNKFFVSVEKSSLANYNSSKESTFLKILNKNKIGPTLFKHNKKNNSIIISFAYGTRIIEYFSLHDKQEILKQIKSVLEQLFIMDKMGINKLELTNPYKHILLSEQNNPIMIDFERSYYGTSKNITQFIQFLTSGRVRHVYKDKNLVVDVEKMRILAKKYKKNIYPEILDDIISSFC